MLRRLADRRRDEDGVTLVLYVLLLVTLLGVSGLVLDYGLVRYDRQHNKSLADTAVTAGMQNLELPGTGTPAPFRGSCAALDFIRANEDKLSGLTGTWYYGDGTPVGLDPCDTTSTDAAVTRAIMCLPSSVPGYLSSWAWFDGTPVNGVDVEIRSGYNVDDASYRDEGYHTDKGSSVQGGCDQMAVVISQTQRAGFGRVVGGGNLTSRIRSVGRVTIAQRADHLIALLLLEQHDCLALDVNGGNTRLEVQGYQHRAGIIHADSAGDGDDCSSNSQILDGHEPGSGESPPILSRQAETYFAPATAPSPGVVSVYALTGNSGTDPSEATDAYGSNRVVYAEGAPSPISNDQLGRGSVDRRYLTPMKSLRSEAASWTSWSTAQWLVNTVDPATGFINIGCPNNGVYPQQKVFIDCSGGSGFSPANTVTFTGTDAQIVINNKVSLSGNGQIVINDASKVYIAGNGNDGLSVGSTDGFVLNRNGYSSCDARAASTASGGGNGHKVEMVVMRGALESSGNGGITLCQTMLYLAGNATLPTIAGTAPEDQPTTSNGYLSVSGGGGIDWTAPNQLTANATTAQLNSTQYRFEDLALWTEYAGSQASIGGSGGINMKGVFFLPKADPFVLAGNGNQVIGEDAQFIVRKLKLGGSANNWLRMRPNPNDAVLFPFFAGTALVR